MSKPRISYVDPAKVEDAAMRAEFDRCAREGTPRPESQAIRAHVPAVFWSFANSWRDVFKNGVAEHGIKELCRIYVSRSVLCEFCGNQRSVKAAKQGMVEDDYRDLINFESSSRYDERQKAALCSSTSPSPNLSAALKIRNSMGHGEHMFIPTMWIALRRTFTAVLRPVPSSTTSTACAASTESIGGSWQGGFPGRLTNRPLCITQVPCLISRSGNLSKWKSKR